MPTRDIRRWRMNLPGWSPRLLGMTIVNHWRQTSEESRIEQSLPDHTIPVCGSGGTTSGSWYFAGVVRSSVPSGVAAQVGDGDGDG